MPLPSGIYRHYGKYRVRKNVGGKRISRTFQTVEEAAAFLRRLEADVADAQAVQRANLTAAATVMEVVTSWWEIHKARVSGQTARNYQLYIDTYISRIGSESAQAYAQNTALLKAFYDTLPNRCAWHVHGVLRMAFRDAVKRGLMDRNPCDVEKPAPRQRKRRLIPSREEVVKLLITAQEQDDRWGLFVYLSATLGTRCGETVAFRTEDFDERNGVVHVERALSKTAGRPTLKLPKSNEARELHIDDPGFWEHVRPLLPPDGFLFPGFYRDADRSGPHVESKPWHPDHAQKRFRAMVRSLGLKPYTLHALRHFVATQLLIEGEPINQVAEFLGHSPQMTLMLYGRHLDREAMRRVGRAAVKLVR